MPHNKVKTLSVSADSDGGAGVSFLEGRSQTRLPGNVVVHLPSYRSFYFGYLIVFCYPCYKTFFSIWNSNIAPIFASDSCYNMANKTIFLTKFEQNYSQFSGILAETSGSKLK